MTFLFPSLRPSNEANVANQLINYDTRPQIIALIGRIAIFQRENSQEYETLLQVGLRKGKPPECRGIQPARQRRNE